MAELDEPPLLSFHRDYTDVGVNNVKRQVYKGRSENGDRTVQVPIDDGTFSIEYRIEQTTRSFKEAAELLQFSNEQLYKEFQRCLAGNALAAWDRVMESGEFQEPAARTAANFERARKAWIFEHHRIKNIGDVMWRHFYRGTLWIFSNVFASFGPQARRFLKDAFPYQMVKKRKLSSTMDIPAATVSGSTDADTTFGRKTSTLSPNSCNLSSKRR